MTQNINNLFADKYNSDEWKELLKVLFKNKTASFYKTPLDRKEKDKKAHETANSILEFGDLMLDDNSRILFYEINLVDDMQVNSRVGLRNIIHSDVIPGDVDGIIATYYNKIVNDWRLTFISKSLYWDEEYNQIKEETHPKRYTYVLGKGESIKTALSQFDWLLNEIRNKEITIKDLIKTFSVEKISNEFFTKYRLQFKSFEAYISDNPDAFSFFKSQVDNNKTNKEQQEDAEKLVRQFVKKLMGRIVFLYFLQKKGWMGVPANKQWGNGEKDFISRLFNSSKDKNDFYNKCLAPLFFNTLNKERYSNNDIFEITQTRIPYLNGGLFDKDQIEPDTIKINPDLFADLFEFFDQYNFTIDENSPDDQDIGIDPEMLGLIFENLLEDNKDKGTFYTPKEVVHFMCKESISQYVSDTLKATATDKELKEISTYIKQSGKIDLEIIKRFAERIDNALNDCKICDPAIGSGAFPMGMVFEIMRLKKELHAFYKQEDFIYLKEKLNIIKNNIYGVDLDKGAVDIARLRFWLSLIVDEKEPKPLPNLDYKIMQGNSLVESFEDISLDTITKESIHVFGPPKQMTLGEEFDAPQNEIEFTIEEKIELKKWVEDYFSIDNLEQKQGLHHKIDKAVLNHLNKNTELYEKSAIRQIAEIEDKYAKAGKNIGDFTTGKDYKTWNTLKTKSETTRKKLQQIQESVERPYFLWHLFFGNILNEGKKGFDIVIGNPPYGGTKIDEKTQKEYKLDSNDPYGAFMSMALNKLLKPDGILCYIVSDTWLTIKSHKPLREQILQYELKNVIRLHKDCFNATVNSCVFTLKKSVIAKKETISIIIAADLTNISTRKQIPEFRNKLFHLEDYIGQYTPDFAVYSYSQKLLLSNNNVPVLVASPKLFMFMNDEGNIENNIYSILFNSKKINLEKIKSKEDVKKGMDSAIKYVYRANESVQVIRTRYNVVDIKKIRSTDEILNLSNIEKLNGVESEEFIIPFNKGGSSSTKEDWLPNYFVDVEYYIDFSELAVKKHYHRNKTFYFNDGLTFSFRGDYSPTFRLKNIGPFDANSSYLSSDNHDKSVFIGVLNSKLVRYIFNAIIQHTVASDIDKIKEIPIVEIDEINSQKINKLVEAIIEKQKQVPKYNYFANEQKEIDQLVYELYGLNEDDINEVETWFARRYPKLAKYAFYQSPEELLQKQLQQVNANDKIKQLLASGESKTVEFKSTLRYCLRENKPQKYVEYSAIKNLAAFLNSEGGTLFIGVDDDSNILGLENTDFASFKGDNKKDEFVKHFDNLIQNYFGNDMVHKFNIEFEVIDGKTIALIYIKDKANSPVIITNPEKNNQEEFYVRRNASAIALTMYEMLNYIKENLG
jgi:hypothetical protein